MVPFCGNQTKEEHERVIPVQKSLLTRGCNCKILGSIFCSIERESFKETWQ